VQEAVKVYSTVPFTPNIEHHHSAVNLSFGARKDSGMTAEQIRHLKPSASGASARSPEDPQGLDLAPEMQCLPAPVAQAQVSALFISSKGVQSLALGTGRHLWYDFGGTRQVGAFLRTARGAPLVSRLRPAIALP